MMRAVALLLLAAVGTDAAHYDEKGKDPLGDFFKACDTNSDGKLSKEELIAHYKTISVAESGATGHGNGAYSQKEAEDMYEMYHGAGTTNADRVGRFFPLVATTLLFLLSVRRMETGSCRLRSGTREQIGQRRRRRTLSFSLLPKPGTLRRVGMEARALMRRLDPLLLQLLRRQKVGDQFVQSMPQLSLMPLCACLLPGGQSCFLQ
jgi:hypothetical protein